MPISDPLASPLSRRRVLGAAVMLGVGAARPVRALADDRGPVMSMLEMRRRNTVVQEWDLSCGAAALATILRYQHGDMVSERELVQQLIRRDIYIENPELVQLRQGFSLLDLKRVVDARGYNGIGFGDLDLEDALEVAPVITPIRTKGYNHFVVLVGQVGNSLHLADPAFGNVTMTTARFDRVWLAFPEIGRVGFVIARGDDPSPSGRLKPDPRVFMTPPPGMIRNGLF